MVLLNQLQQHEKYNGVIGWPDVEALEASAGGAPKLLLVHLEGLCRFCHQLRQPVPGQPRAQPDCQPRESDLDRY
jgi:hypothetical protein